MVKMTYFLLNKIS